MDSRSNANHLENRVIIIIIIIIVLRPFSTQKHGLDDTNKFMLDLILAKDIQNRMPFRFRCSGLFSHFPDHTGPFLRDSVLLFGSAGELTISQNHHHEGTKEQIGRPPYASSLKSLVGPGSILIAFYDLQ